MSPRNVSLLVLLVLVSLLLGARVLEVASGHVPSTELTVAFSSAVTALLAVLVGSHISNGGSH